MDTMKMMLITPDAFAEIVDVRRPEAEEHDDLKTLDELLEMDNESVLDWLDVFLETQDGHDHYIRYLYRQFDGSHPERLNLGASMATKCVIVGNAVCVLVRCPTGTTDEDEDGVLIGEMTDGAATWWQETFLGARLWHDQMFSKPIIDRFYGGDNPF